MSRGRHLDHSVRWSAHRREAVRLEEEVVSAKRGRTHEVQRVGGKVEVGVEREDIVASRECLASEPPAL